MSRFYISLDPNNQRNRAELAERARLRGLAEQAREDRADVARALASVVTALEDLKAAAAPASTLDDMARAAYDAISERDHLLRKDIDAEFGEPLGPLYPAEELDLSELRDFFIEERK